jgi:hypothetical protein
MASSTVIKTTYRIFIHHAGEGPEESKLTLVEIWFDHFDDSAYRMGNGFQGVHMPIFIHNLRAGFATNSSSSHSVVLIPEDMVGKFEPINETETAFGETEFRLVSTEDKMRYLAALLLGGGCDQKKLVEIFTPHLSNIAELVASTETDDDEQYNYGYGNFYVSGNSQISHPADPLHPAYVHTLINLFQSNRIVVVGGRDDSANYPFVMHGCEEEELFETLKSSYNNSVREEGNHITIFDKRTGNKVRMSVKDEPYLKSSVPELVDLKITDYCAAGCKFCYQSSTEAGKHASMKTLRSTINLLAKMKVFEIAIGGGEPTDHPDFVEILKEIAGHEMVANFTTLSDRWLADPAKLQAVQTYVKAIGVSCSSAKGLALVEEINATVNPGWQRVKVMAQHVVGAQPLWVTAEFINAALSKKIPILLLGYKNVGFGKEFTRHDEGQDVAFFLKMAVSSFKDASVSVDTALLDQHPSIPSLLGAPIALTTSPEGKFSCYIDAVTKRMAASSYVEPTLMEPLQTSVEGFKKAYAKY